MSEIKIDYTKISLAEKNLRELKTTIENTDMNLIFTESKGETVDTMLELATELEKARDSLAKLCENTLRAFMATRTSFHRTDTTLAKDIRLIGGGNEKTE